MWFLAPPSSALPRPPSFPVAASEAQSEDASKSVGSVGVGAKNTAREGNKRYPLHSTPRVRARAPVASFRLPPPFVRSFVRSILAFTLLCALQHSVSSDDDEATR